MNPSDFPDPMSFLVPLWAWYWQLTFVVLSKMSQQLLDGLNLIETFMFPSGWGEHECRPLMCWCMEIEYFHSACYVCQSNCIRCWDPYVLFAYVWTLFPTVCVYLCVHARVDTFTCLCGNEWAFKGGLCPKKALCPIYRKTKWLIPI